MASDTCPDAAIGEVATSTAIAALRSNISNHNTIVSKIAITANSISSVGATVGLAFQATSLLIFADSAAYLEGDCADSSTGGVNRVAYCVAYDVTGDKITAMRCYGAIAHLAP